MGIQSPLVQQEQPKRLFTEKEAAYYLGMSPEFLRKGRIEGHIPGRTPTPPYKKLGARSVRYSREALDAWIDQFQDQWHTSQSAAS